MLRQCGRWAIWLAAALALLGAWQARAAVTAAATTTARPDGFCLTDPQPTPPTCDATWSGNVFGTIAASREKVKVGDRVTVTAVPRFPEVGFTWVQGERCVPGGPTSVTLSVPGKILSFSPKTSDDLPVSVSGSSVTLSGGPETATANPQVGIRCKDGTPTSTIPLGTPLTVTFEVTSSAQAFASARFAGTVGFVSWADSAIWYFNYPRPATLSGTVRAKECSPADGKCTPPTALAGVTVRATPITKKGTEGQAVTAADGTYSLKLPEGDYRVTPSLGDAVFSPSERKVSLAGDRSGIDFEACAASEPPAATPASTAARALAGFTPCSVLEVEISADPKSPFVEQVRKGPVPEPVRITVRVTNRGSETVNDVTLPEKLTIGRLTHEYEVLAIDPKKAPGKAARRLGSIQPGRHKQLVYRYEADGDGRVSIEALVTGGLGRQTVKGLGKLELELRTQVVYVFAEPDTGRETRSPARPKLLRAGTPFALRVKVDNRSSERKVVALPTLKSADGNLIGGVWRRHSVGPLGLFLENSLAAPPPFFAITIEPRRSEELDLVFTSNTSSYALADASEAGEPAGGTRATLVLAKPDVIAPPAGEPDAELDQWETVAPELVAITRQAGAPNALPRFSWSFDDSGMTPRTWNGLADQAIAYGIFTAGTYEGGLRWVWGSVRALAWDLPGLVVRGVASLPAAGIAFTEQSVALWEAIKDDPAAQAAFLGRVHTAVLTLGNSEVLRLIEEKGPGFWDAINAQVLKDLTEMHAQWYGGDWQAAMRSGGVATGQTALDVATLPVIETQVMRFARGIKLSALAATPEAIQALRLAEEARQAEIAAALETKIAARPKPTEAVDLLRTEVQAGRRVGTGFRFANTHLPGLFGLAESQAAFLRDFARRNKVLLTIRSRATESIAWARGAIDGIPALLKPEWIKTKNVNVHDVAYLGYDRGDIGRVVVLVDKPPGAPEVERRLRAAKVQEGSKEWNAVLERRLAREQEFTRDAAMWDDWKANPGERTFDWNWRDNAVDPTKAPEIAPDRVRVSMVPVPAPPAKPRKFIPKVEVLDPITGLPDGVGARSITGDVDIVQLSDIDGRPLPDEVYARLLKELRGSEVGANHATTDTWVKDGKIWFKAKEEQLQPGQCCFAQFGPDGDVRAVSLNLGLSFLKQPPFTRRNFRLFWDGGYQHTVGFHTRG